MVICFGRTANPQSCLPLITALIVQRTISAPRPGGAAYGPAKPDKVGVKRIPLPLGHNPAHLAKSFFGRSGSGRKLKTTADSVNMRIHREDVSPQRKEEDARSCFWADTGIPCELLHDPLIRPSPDRIQRAAAELFPDFMQDILYPQRLLICHAAGTDRARNHAHRSVSDLLPGPTSISQTRIGAMAVLVVRILRQNSGNEDVQWGRKMGRLLRDAETLFQTCDNGPCFCSPEYQRTVCRLTRFLPRALVGHSTSLLRER